MAHAPSINGRFELPAIPGNTSASLAAHIADYQVAFSGIPDGDERWEAAVAAIHAFVPESLNDLAAKLIVAIHYRDPCLVDGRWAIMAPEAKCDRLAVEMELGCLDWLLASTPALAAADLEAWDRAMSEHGRFEMAERAAFAADNEDEAEFQQGLRFLSEDKLMEMPSPNAAAFAQKILIAISENRASIPYQEAIEADARRLVGMGA